MGIGILQLGSMADITLEVAATSQLVGWVGRVGWCTRSTCSWMESLASRSTRLHWTGRKMERGKHQSLY